MNYLRQSTAVTIHIGPAVDKTDGVTPETGLTAGGVDEIGVYKHESPALTDISGTTTFTHRAGGMYTLTLATGDVGTLGLLKVYIRDDDVCLPFWRDFLVVDANFYDAMMGTDYLNSEVAAMAADVITSSAFDENTAFPLKAPDSGATIVARTGADGDTLKTISDEIALVLADTAELQENQGNWLTADVSGLSTSAALAIVDGIVDQIKAILDKLDIPTVEEIEAEFASLHGDGPWGQGVPDGYSLVPYTLKDGDGVGVAGVWLKCTLDEAGSQILDWRLTNAQGVATFVLAVESGTTVYIWHKYSTSGDMEVVP